MKRTKDIVAGLGEIGKPIFSLLSKSDLVIGYDVNKKLMNQNNFKKFKNLTTSFLHICFPYTKNFEKNVIKLFNEFKPDCIVIHSTIKPNTTSLLQKNYQFQLFIALLEVFINECILI